MTESNKNLQNLFLSLGFDQKHAQESAREISHADDAFDQADAPPGEARALAHLHNRIRALQHQQQRRRHHRRWLYATTGLAAALLIGLLLLRAAWFSHPDSPMATPATTTASAMLTEEEELALWQVAIEQHNIAQLQIDEVTIVEGLLWLEEPQPDETTTPGQAHTPAPNARLT